MEFSVQSPANIAFLKYWGQADATFVLPCNDSFSMNLSDCYTTIDCVVLDDPTIKTMKIQDYETKEYVDATTQEMNKVLSFYEISRQFLKEEKDIGFQLTTSNSFPKKAGIASSASFFSALALTFTHAFGKELTEKELSELARLSGSGSACRSIPEGFVWWHKGTDSQSSYAESIANAEYWDLQDIVLVLSKKEKQVSSAEGHTTAKTSPYFAKRIEQLPEIQQKIRDAFETKDFTTFGTLLEQECVNFCSILFSQQPPLIFWSGKTVECIKKIIALRQSGIEAYYTIDAGENIHLICEGLHRDTIVEAVKTWPEVEEYIVNTPCKGSHIL